MIPLMMARAGGNVLSRVVNGDKERLRNDPEYRSKRRRRKVAGGLGVVALTTGGVLGIPKMLENINPISTETTVDGGSQELIKFDLEAEFKCWTAATIQVANAGAKDEAFVEVMGTKNSVGYRETKALFQVEDFVCNDKTPIEVTSLPEEGRWRMNLPNADSLYTMITLVPGTFFPQTTQKGTYAVADLFTTATESAPYLGETEYSKGLSLADDIQKNKLATLALFAGMMNAKENCQDMTTKLAGPAVEVGLKNIYLPGMNLILEEKGEKAVTPDDIDVLVEGKPISELEILGKKTNIDEDYAKAMAIQKESGTITVSKGDKADCKASEEVQKMLDEAEQENSEAGRN